MQLLREQSCLEYPNLKAELTKFTKKQLENGSYFLDFVFTVKERLPITLEASFSLMKCNLAGNPDSCEYYTKNLRFKNFCEKISQKNEVWSQFIDSSVPSILCPINPGTYEMNYVAERNDVFQFIPFPVGVWKLQSILFDGKKMEQRTMRILRIQSCPEYPDLPVKITKLSKRHFNEEFYAFNISFIVKEKISVNIESYNTVNKCDLAGTPDSCEIFLKDFHVKNICGKMNLKNQLWSASLETIKPPLRCPIQADKYELNFKGKSEFFKFFPLPTAVWKAKSILFGGHKMIVCVNTEVKKQRTMRFLRLQMCPEYPDLPLMVTKFNKRHFADDTIALNISFKIREKLPVNLDASLTLVKCDLAGTPDSCEIYVKDFKVKNLCEKVGMKNQLWSTAIDSIKPPFHCPIEPDNYELNLKRKIQLFKFLPLPTAIWKEKVIVVGDQKMILCLNVEIQVIERNLK
ncbi:hypothetical protein WA026_005636 [Henosepilachna vigintioctopunctata]|uniref:Uncharacterized protein n=1 Tax=Henosepilachna vigintioctopunctata TaxID=420089 RepID=A0AAW1TTG8_9CUCU